ncbi:transcriptional regulator, TetR family [Streptoalloteichus hindustanus]|uniref:Transcriptional regulator, TetR family n=2 Tax=Streptoalloteichus hindustanus TaxID=2017 RepID=A0A1M5CIX8_STRHI|nr:transcriptional regulator, TetR family [Streptoalloteichus hindustanus]
MRAASADSGEVPGLRADAAHNRNRIVEVARTLFAERGIDVPMATIARHARVGVATLYRRFPTRESLITEAFADQFAACLSVVDEALADPDPWRGFCSVIEKICAVQTVDRCFVPAFVTAFPDAVDIERGRERAMWGFAELTRRAKQSGHLRADFATDDLTLLLMATRGITADSPERTLAASRRLVAYLLNSVRADHADPNEPLPPSVPLSVHDLLRSPR